MPDELSAIRAVKGFLIESIRGKVSPSEKWHPWRKGWEFVYLHSLRVDAICQQLRDAEVPDLPPADALALRLAAILHDIGRIDDRENHASLGARLTADWLRANPEVAGQVGGTERVVELVAQHSQKDQPGPTLSHALLKDADALDEIGVFSLLMAANHIDPASPFYLYDLASRLEQYEIPFIERTAARLQTATAHVYLAQKRSFMESVIAQFTIELAGVPREIEQG